MFFEYREECFKRFFEHRTKTHATMFPFVQYLWLEYRYESSHLNFFSITSKSLCVLMKCRSARELIAVNTNHCSPFGKNRPLFLVGQETCPKIEKPLSNKLF